MIVSNGQWLDAQKMARKTPFRRFFANFSMAQGLCRFGDEMAA
ncbi:MAG: hypothetical protein ACOYD9_00370 [Pyramidobacter sp.]|jgi:hypothetical protein